jgi:hypothetical protein
VIVSSREEKNGQEQRKFRSIPNLDAMYLILFPALKSIDLFRRSFRKPLRVKLTNVRQPTPVAGKLCFLSLLAPSLFPK